MFQFILFLLSHPNWDIRKAAHGTTRKILVASPPLSEAILLEFSDYLSVVGEKATLLKMRWSSIVNMSTYFASFIPLCWLHRADYLG